jgi:hypothetical protein
MENWIVCLSLEYTYSFWVSLSAYKQRDLCFVFDFSTLNTLNQYLFISFYWIFWVMLKYFSGTELVWFNLWMLYIRVTGRGGQKGRCRGLSASATFPLSLPFQPLPKAVFCRHEPVSLSSLPYVPFPPTLRTCEYSVWVKEGMPITDPPPSWNVLFLENI